MRDDLTEIICVVDKSGSMGPRAKDAIGGFNGLLAEQKKLPGEALLTLVLFDTAVKTICDGQLIQEVRELTSKEYEPGGMTALLDAIGATIDKVGKRLEATSEENRPGKIIMVVITDGEENSSKEYAIERIKEMIEHQKNMYLWQFVFLGADQNAWHTADRLGVGAAGTMVYDAATSKGVANAYIATSQVLCSYRNTGTLNIDRQDLTV